MKDTKMQRNDTIDPSETNDPFQKIMEKAGTHGRFQLIYNLIFVMGLAAAGTMVYLNIILALNIPDHWCTVPGREHTNYSLDEWRRITLPIQKDNRGADKYSSCEMYDRDFTKIEDWRNLNSTRTANVTVCQHGWSYDKTWYEGTIPTKENWVCAKDLFVTNIFAVERVAEVIGSFVFGQMGDIFGRRIVYFIGIIFCALGRMLSILTTSWYMCFLMLSGLASLTINVLFQAPPIIGIEISRKEDRSTIAIYQSFGYSIGTTVLPLIFWWLRDGETAMWFSSIPMVVIISFSMYFIESPRWLISKCRFADAIVQFKKIAKINGRRFNMTETELALMFKNTHNETTYGIASLFSHWRLAKNTMILGFSWCLVSVAYFTLVLFSSFMGGNPYLNFLMQSIVDLPGYLFGKYLADRYGRRFTNSSAFLISFVTCLPIIYLTSDVKYNVVVMCLSAFIKFLNSVTFYTASLQRMEIYPTCIRNTGVALGSLLANAVGILSPYLVYLGTTVDIRGPYYTLGTLFLIGGIGTLFLPETLHKKLPDTMDEAREFGRRDKFFSLPKAPAKEENLWSDATEKLNQEKYAL